MMTSSQSERSPNSPIRTVPYDVLLEIFINCLPRHRFRIRQPNTRIAPILLCHICSSWRTVALASPTLWSHLSYRLRPWKLSDEEGVRLFVFPQNEIDFIRWWKKNQGPMAPFLRLAIERNYDIDGIEVPLARDGISFVVNYVSTAQHLEIERIFWDEVLAMVEHKDGSDDVTFPNLHTFVTSPINNSFYRTFSALRRLALPDYEHLTYDTTIPAQWSALTHLSIAAYYIYIDFWVSLTSTVPCLQWVYISFDSLLGIANHVNPIQRTLPRLSTLLIKSGCNGDCLIKTLFKALHLPALNYLFLSSDVRNWWDHRDVLDIHTSLQSTPALKNLTLRTYKNLSPTEINSSIATLATAGDVAPVWSSTPHLVHLQLELAISDDSSEIKVEKKLDTFSRSAFFSNNRWLDLDNPACPINKITVIDHGSTSPGHQSKSDTHRKTPAIQKSAGNASNIAFHLRSEPFIDFAGSWKKWRLGM